MGDVLFDKPLSRADKTRESRERTYSICRSPDQISHVGDAPQPRQVEEWLPHMQTAASQM